MVCNNIVYKKESSMVQSVSVKNSKKEFMTRVMSSLIFIPIIALFIFASYSSSLILCCIVYMMMLYEIVAVRTQFPEHKKLYILGAAVCLLGVISFAYCRKHFGIIGCGFLICTTCFTDIGAYLFGKTFGGPKLCPKISPNKTWAGFWGGIFLSNFSFYCFYRAFLKSGSFFSFFSEHDLNIFVFVQIIILAAVIGDLAESYFKRKVGVKDMGSIIPGHGGILDRLDSLLFTSIVLAATGILLEASW